MVEVNFNLRYPGQYFDQESGLYYNYFRSYSPNTGEYTQPDPIGLKGGWNRFVYAGGNSISGIDPWGLETCVVVTRGTGGVGTHAALYMSNVRRNENNRTTTPVIYDPAGSYSGRDNFSYGPKADLNKFADYHKKKDGETTEKTCKNTTAEEEQRLYEKALAEGPQGGLACSISVSNVVSGSSYFPNVKPGTFFPGNLFNQARR